MTYFVKQYYTPETIPSRWQNVSEETYNFIKSLFKTMQEFEHSSCKMLVVSSEKA